MTTLELYEKLRNDYDPQKEHPEKFLHTLQFVESDNKDLLEQYGIKLKPSQWIVLAIEPELLNKTLVRAKELGFLEAYIQNPSYLKQDVDVVIKRIGELEHLGIPYKSEKGKYQSFLFSQRGYNYIVAQSKKKSNLETESVKNVELEEYAKRVVETFALTNEAENIYKRLIEVEKEGLSDKETLMEVFKTYSDNIEYLSACIDDILASYREEKMGRVA